MKKSAKGRREDISIGGRDEKYFENIVRRIVTMSTQTPELNTARVNTNVENDTTIEFNDESENNKRGRSGTGRYNRNS